MGLAVLVAVLVIPSVAGVGEDMYSEHLRAAAIQAQTRNPIQATVVSDNETVVDNATIRMVTVKWKLGGSEHTSVIRPSHPVDPGDQVPIWVDDNGRRVPPPMSASTATAYAVAAAVALWLGTVLLCALVVAATRQVLNRRRSHAWSVELRELLDLGDGRTKWHH